MIFWFEKEEIGEKSRIKGNSRFYQGYPEFLKKVFHFFRKEVNC